MARVGFDQFHQDAAGVLGVDEVDARVRGAAAGRVVEQPDTLVAQRRREPQDDLVTRIAQELDAGCLFIGGAAEMDDRPGPVRDALAASVSLWLAALHRAVTQAQAEGHLPADWDAHQVTFELHGLVLALHHEARFLRSASALTHARRGFERVLGQRA